MLNSPVRPAPEPGLLGLRRRWLEDADRGRDVGATLEKGKGEGELAGRRVVGDVKEEGERKRGQREEVKRRRLRVVCYNILADM